MKLRASLIVGTAAFVLSGSFPARAEEKFSATAEAWSQQLVDGHLSAGEKLVADRLAAAPTDDEARLALGVTQTLEAVQGLMQSLYRYGLDPVWAEQLPFVRLPVPKNPKPEALTNEAFREMLATFATDLEKAEKTLARIKSADVKLPLLIGSYRLDFDGDGTATEQEAFWQVLNAVASAGITKESASEFVIMADKGDVHWLRGYCHVLQSLCEMYLAYDTQPSHDRVAQLFFPHADVKNPIVTAERNPNDMVGNILDVVAFVHLVQLPVAEPERLKRAHEHLLAVIDQSRESWKAIQAEIDDDLEWIPAPQQKNCVIQGARITPEMVEGWHAALAEAEKVLKGEKLAPFWRGGTKGLNIKRIFTEPTTFDLVLWIQGSAAQPYLDEGEITDAELWRDITRGFQGQLFFFAIWVN